MPTLPSLVVLELVLWRFFCSYQVAAPYLHDDTSLSLSAVIPAMCTTLGLVVDAIVDIHGARVGLTSFWIQGDAGIAVYPGRSLAMMGWNVAYNKNINALGSSSRSNWQKHSCIQIMVWCQNGRHSASVRAMISHNNYGDLKRANSSNSWLLKAWVSQSVYVMINKQSYVIHMIHHKMSHSVLLVSWAQPSGLIVGMQELRDINWGLII